ncbi:hypothetical protein F5Y11DRAFT_367404 [Daldinia sp. FL1419]|nr:hypothetical protein F5Y11DRAFT_367404 [Daldinia sp. FL1419]
MARGNDSLQTFKCAIGGEWLAADGFSRAQMTKWEKIRNNVDVTPENAGLVCKDHAQQTEAPQEVKCNGPCGLWKHKNHFSKRQRNDPNARCISCTSWAISFAGNEIPPAPPNSRVPETEMTAGTTGVQAYAPTNTPAPVVGEALPTYQQIQSGPVEVGEVDRTVLQQSDSMMRIRLDGTFANGPSTNSDYRGPTAPTTTVASSIESSVPQFFVNPTVPVGETPPRLYGGSPFAPPPGGWAPQDPVNVVDEANKVNGAEGGSPRRKAEVPKGETGKKFFKADSRRVYFATPAYASYPTDPAGLRAREGDSDSGSEIN